VLKMLWVIIVWWFDNNVMKPIQRGAEKGLKAIVEGFANSFGRIPDIVKSALNRVIDFMNSMISRVTSGLNRMIGLANSVGSIVPGFQAMGQLSAPQIPRLASGAVIPPNAEFLAVLGDQKSGRNIEAPEGLIRQIINEEIGNIEAKISVTFEGTMAALVRELNPKLKAENVRIGKSLISGSIA